MPKFQRRHYESVAAVLADSLVSAPGDMFVAAEVDGMIERFARVFAVDNAAFDVTRFRRAIVESPRLQPRRRSARK